jgi:hypothetical protein
LKRKKAEKESFAETVLLLRKLLVGELMTNASIDGNVELLLRGPVMMYSLFMRLFVLGNPCSYRFFYSF